LDSGIEHWSKYQDAGVHGMERVATSAYDAMAAAGGLGGATRNLTRDAEAAEAAAKQHAKALDDEKRALDGAFNATMALDRANLDVAGATYALKAAIDANGRSLDATKEKGIANRRVILDQIGALERQRDAAIAAGDGSKKGMDAANRAFDSALKKLIDLAAKAGFSRSELEKMAKKYNITVTTTYRDVHVNEGAQRALDLPKPKKKALGGRAFANEPYTVGDGGRPELFIPDTNGYIAPRVPASMSGGGGGSGGGVRIAPIQMPAGSFEDIFFQHMQDYVRTRYGGDVVVAFGGRR
jgi:hypothetical protein